MAALEGRRRRRVSFGDRGDQRCDRVDGSWAPRPDRLTFGPNVDVAASAATP